jgi:hypothetical protein
VVYKEDQQRKRYPDGYPNHLAAAIEPSLGSHKAGYMDFPVPWWRNRCSGHTAPFWPSPVRLQREEPPQRQELRISLVCSFNDPVLQYFIF